MDTEVMGIAVMGTVVTDREVMNTVIAGTWTQWPWALGSLTQR